MSKTTKKILIGVSVVLIILAGALGFWFYTRYQDSQKVADSVNKNVDILNTNAEENKKILNSISEDFSSIEKSPTSQTEHLFSEKIVKRAKALINNILHF